MGYTITTLVENCVYGRKLQAEHGLSLYRMRNGMKRCLLLWVPREQLRR